MMEIKLEPEEFWTWKRFATWFKSAWMVRPTEEVVVAATERTEMPSGVLVPKAEGLLVTCSRGEIVSEELLSLDTSTWR